MAVRLFSGIAPVFLMQSLSGSPGLGKIKWKACPRMSLQLVCQLRRILVGTEVTLFQPTLPSASLAKDFGVNKEMSKLPSTTDIRCYAT